MKILLALPRPLFPPDTGGKIRSLNIFSRLARSMEIHALSLAQKGRDESAIDEMRRLFHSYTPVFWKEAPKFSLPFYAEFIRSWFSPFPYFISKYRLPGMEGAARLLADREHFDLLLCDFLQAAVALLDSPVRPRVIFEHNVEFLIRMRHWQTETSLFRKRILRAEFEKARRVETDVCKAFDHVIAVSEDDRRVFEQHLGIIHTSAIPTGVDIDFFRPQQVSPVPGRLVFVGSMDWHPNEDGVIWLLREVYPRIRRDCPHASLTVVGRNPSSRVRALAAASGVEVTGTVEDVRPYLAQAEVVVVPLRFGGGTRIKILEALSMARPVVSTTLGAEGLPLEAGREILLEDDPEGFALAVCTLVNDRTRREALARAGREKVERDHTWEKVAASMADILEKVARGGGMGRSPAGPVAVPDAHAMLSKGEKGR